MIHCFSILLVALPVTCYLVGGLLILVALVAVGLFLLKSREVASLKKEVEDLRDTMRMMRYEEASLSRMLHTVDKSPTATLMSEPTDVSSAEEVQEEPMVMEREAEMQEPERRAEEPIVEEVIEETAEESIEESIEEMVDESLEEDVDDSYEAVERQEALAEETIQNVEVELSASGEALVSELIEEAAIQAAIVTDEALEPVDEEEVGVVETEPAESIQPIIEVSEPQAVEDATEGVEQDLPKVETASRKQAINERRPAIPHDLFSAWFAENEDVEEEVVKEDVAPLHPSVTIQEPDSPVDSVPAVQETQISQDALNKTAQIQEAAEASSEVQADEEILDATSEESIEAPKTEEEMAAVKMNKEDERFCRKLERIVNTRMRNPDLNIDVIASQFGMGRTNFYRKVRELMGMSPNDYLRKCRMERAAALIKDTNMPIAEICAQVGVPDAQYFSRVFKTFYGVPPSTYREQL